MKVTNELGVIVYFAQHCQSAGLEILEIQADYPDARIIDLNTKKEYLVEFEFDAKNFIGHRHDPFGCHFIICWKNSLPGFPLQYLELSKTGWENFRYRDLDEKDTEILKLKLAVMGYRHIQELKKIYQRPEMDKDIIELMNLVVIELCKVANRIGFSNNKLKTEFGDEFNWRPWTVITDLLCQKRVVNKYDRVETMLADGWNIQRLETELLNGSLIMEYPFSFTQHRLIKKIVKEIRK